ncbi:lipopolysaccharide biosynthesis protein [Vibrio breoganii]|uniref:lipopolysaccharide biosynthesis protein n=1 Tax=Vibrio breoganii TaxID=553239 RepID=UPI0035544F85
MKFKTDNSINRVLKNSGFVAFRFIIYTVSGFIFVPFLIGSFGTADYGLIALAGFLTQYVGMISNCIGSSVARFLNIALNKDDIYESNEIYNTALVSNIALILINIPVFAYCLYNLDIFFDFEIEKSQDLFILVLCNVLVFFIALLTGVFKTSIQASNRIDISAKIDIIKIVVRLILIYAGVHYIGASLWIIGVVDLVLALLSAIFFILISGKLAPELVIDRTHINKKWISPVLKMSSWSLVGVLGFSLITQTDTWLINRFVDKEVAGIFAALLVWPNLVKQVTKQFESIIAPVLLIDFAKGNLKRFDNTLRYSSRFLASGGGIITGLLFVLVPFIVEYWLKVNDDSYSLLLYLMLFYLALTLSESVLWRYFQISNKMNQNGIISIGTGLFNIVLSVVFINFGYGYLGVAFATSISLLIKDAVLVPVIICKNTSLKFSQFINDYLISIFLMGFSYFGFSQIMAEILNGNMINTLLFSMITIVLLIVFLIQANKKLLVIIYSRFL